MTELLLNRRLNKKEKIHHIDGNKINNNESNLQLCKDMSEHRKIHHSLEKISMLLVNRGIINFDRNKKEYYISSEIIEQIEDLGYNKEFISDKSFLGGNGEDIISSINTWSKIG